MAASHLWDLVERAALVNGAGPAIINAQGVRTWRETRAAMEGLAQKLVGAGVARGDRVALLAANSERFIHALFAIARIGAIAAPLNTRLTLDEMAGQISNAEPAILLTDATFAPQARALHAQGAAPRLVGLEGAIDDISGIDDAPSSAPPPLGGAEETVCLLYTGGTTGQPKGVSFQRYAGDERVPERQYSRRCARHAFRARGPCSISAPSPMWWR